MTEGALIFAFNNEAIDYLSMAAWSAKNIHRHLDIPVCVVTDEKSVPPIFDHVVKIDRCHSDSSRQFADLDQSVTWFNRDRVDAYVISPWDKTLVLDADYVVASDFLLSPLRADIDFFCYRWAWDLASLDCATNPLNYFGTHKMPMSWATVMMFQRCDHARRIFEHMAMVRDHWPHYNDIYGLGRSSYRNDFALSISLSLMAGHWPGTAPLDVSMFNVLPEQTLLQDDADQYQIIWQDPQGKQRRVQLIDQDFHAMGKKHLETVIGNHR